MAAGLARECASCFACVRHWEGQLCDRQPAELCWRRSTHAHAGRRNVITLQTLDPLTLRAVLQYAPLPGLPELRQAVARHAEATHPGISVDPATEAIITLGATEALASAMLAFLNPGDEVDSLGRAA